MGIILDPSRQFVSIDIFYIEEVKKHGNSVFHFVESKSDLDEWKAKGYVMETEVEKPLEKTGEDVPGAPITNTKVISKLNTQWKRLTWKDQNMIFSRALKQIPMSDGRTRTELDTIIYRDMKLKTCLKRWDLVDDNKVSIVCDETMIDLLDPTVAQQMLNEFEKVTEASGEDLGN